VKYVKKIKSPNENSSQQQKATVHKQQIITQQALTQNYLAKSLVKQETRFSYQGPPLNVLIKRTVSSI